MATRRSACGPGRVVYGLIGSLGVVIVLNKTLRLVWAAAALICCQHAVAQDITRAMILQVIEATDEAAVRQDTAAIGEYLASGFYKFIDVPEADPPVTIRLDKEQYLELIEQGWDSISEYRYERSDIIINISKDGEMGESNSTILETHIVDGKEMISKVREYATYQMEDGKPVIIMIDSHRLVGDTSL